MTRGAPKGNQYAKHKPHQRFVLSIKDDHLEMIYDALAIDGNGNPSKEDIKQSVYYAIRQVYGRKIEDNEAIII